MNRRLFLKNSSLTIASAVIGASASSCSAYGSDSRDGVKLLNPYARVDWKRVQQHKAALHLHTQQSDARQSVKEVIEAYRRAGFSIVSVTDHDWNYPNGPYPEKKPANYPANCTWPWPDYGVPAPEQMGMVGIQGNELTYKHHINSYYNDYGVFYGRPGKDFEPGKYVGKEAPYRITDANGNEVTEDDQLRAIGAKGGLAIVNHPSSRDKHDWWERKPLDWYVEKYRKHPFRYLIGIEVTNREWGTKLNPYDEGLWDQLLACFMPDRPVWGFGNDDMHDLVTVQETFNLVLVEELTDANVRQALIEGQFCFTATTKLANYKSDPPQMAVFPIIRKIEADEAAGTITIDAAEYDEIKWISAPASLEPTADYKVSDTPWQLGQVVQTGRVVNYRTNEKIRNYVRAEIIRRDGDDINRVFTNPFGISR